MKHLILITTLFIGLNGCAQQELNLIPYVLEQLNLNIENVKTDLMVSKIHPDNPKETIVVIPEIAEASGDHFTLNSYILITDTETGKIKYTYFESAKTNEWDSSAVGLECIKIGTTAYAIAKRKNALGVRVYYRGSSGPNPFYYETISLFVVESNALKNVLKNYTIDSFSGEWDTHCAGEFTDHKKILSVSCNKTNGFFDLLIENTITERETFVTNDNDCDEKITINTEKRTLKYVNGNYK